MVKRSCSFLVLFCLIFFQSILAIAEVIEDDVVSQSFKGQSLSKPVYKREIIEDEVVKDLQNKNLTRPEYKKTVFDDEIIKNDVSVKACTKPAVHYKLIDENAEIVRISMSPATLITTKNGLKIGQQVSFIILKDVYKNGELFIKKDTSVNAFIELISKAERYGDPDEIELGRFSTKDIKGNIVELDGTIRKQGANRAKWVKPLYYIGASAPIPCAPLMVFYFVKGGKTKIAPEQSFELYYQ